MDKQLKEYLKTLGLNEKQIQEILEKQSNFIMLTYEQAKENIEILCDFGYPIEDIDMLIYSNPSILLYSPEDLEDELFNLGDNVEETLKDDPFAI